MRRRGPHWAAAVLYNGLGRYEEAASAARKSSRTPSTHGRPCGRSLSSRGGRAQRDTKLARDALKRLTERQDLRHRLGTRDRGPSRALLTRDEPAEGLYQDAIHRLGRTRLRPELARAELLYGSGCVGQTGASTRRQLRAAYDRFTAIGMEAFAERLGAAAGDRWEGAQADGRDTW
jgi:hypothetical protein